MKYKDNDAPLPPGPLDPNSEASAKTGAPKSAPLTEPPWQPIETAPRDGTIILGINDCWFTDGAPLKVRFSRGEWELYPLPLTFKALREMPDPTHWKPLGNAALKAREQSR